MEGKRISTDELLKILFKEPSVERYFEQTKSETAPSFAEYLTAWCRRLGEVPERVILRANLEKSFGHQLFSGRRRPSRDTVIQLAFALGADVEETQRFLTIARKSRLYPRVRRDAVILHCLQNRRSLVDTCILLSDLGLAPLGGRNE